MNIIVAVWLCFDAGLYTHGEAMELIESKYINDYTVIDQSAPLAERCQEMYLVFSKAK